MKYIVLVISCILLTDGDLREEYRVAADKNIIAVLGKGELKENKSIEGKEFYFFLSENGNDKSHVVFSSAPGRYDKFDYMIILSPDLVIKNIKILKYRSEFGYEISNKGWLRQFYDKPGTTFEYRKTIDALSGATYSAPSLVEDVNKIISYLRDENKQR